MKTISLLLISVVILSFSSQAQSSEQQEEIKVHPTIQPKKAEHQKKDVIEAEPSSESKTYERRTIESPEQKPTMATSPTRKAVTTGGVQTNQSSEPKKMTEAEEVQPKVKQIEREVPQRSDPKD